MSSIFKHLPHKLQTCQGGMWVPSWVASDNELTRIVRLSRRTRNLRDIFGDVNSCLRYAEDLKLVYGQSRRTLGHELAFVWNTTIHGMHMPISSLNKYFNYSH